MNNLRRQNELSSNFENDNENLILRRRPQPIKKFEEFISDRK